MSEACVDAVTRTRFCSHCNNAQYIKPCQNLCLNTMRGCLASLAEVNPDWNAYISEWHGPSWGVDTEVSFVSCERHSLLGKGKDSLTYQYQCVINVHAQIFANHPVFLDTTIS